MPQGDALDRRPRRQWPRRQAFTAHGGHAEAGEVGPVEKGGGGRPEGLDLPVLGAPLPQMGAQDHFRGQVWPHHRGDPFRGEGGWSGTPPRIPQ